MRSLIIVIMLLIATPTMANEVWASWYKHGTRTANGERYNPYGLTVAHRTLPFGTILELTRDGKSVIVRVNDRGPFIKGRTLDLSLGAAQKLGCIKSGICKVKMIVLDKPKKR